MPVDAIPRLKAQLRLAINRLKLVQKKKITLSKQNRRDLLPLLESGKVASARIRVENIIQEDIHVELLELLEVYCELLLARTAVIDATLSADDRVKEAVYSILYAAPHTELKELQTLRAILAHILTKEVLADAADNLTQQVPHRVISKVHVGIPSDELVSLYLTEIVKAYGASVPGIYTPEISKDEGTPSSSEKPEIRGQQPDASESPEPEAAISHTTKSAPQENDAPTSSNSNDELWARFAALKKP